MQASPEITVTGLNLSPAATHPPDAQTECLDAHTLPSIPSGHVARPPQHLIHYLCCRATPACSQRNQSAPPTPAVPGLRSAIQPQCPAGRYTVPAESENPPAKS